MDNSKKLILKFAIILASALIVFGIGFFAVYSLFSNNSSSTVTLPPTATPNPDAPALPNGQSSGEINNNSSESLLSAPRKTNFLILGLDQSKLLSDIVLVGCFDSYTKKIDIISIPRDTKVTLDPEDVQTIKQLGSHYIPSSGIMKLTDLHSYAEGASKGEGHKYSEKYCEKILGISIDFYVEIDTAAFRYIVDEVGGIKFTVRKGGYNYQDSDQPNGALSINIPEGEQILTGKQAEGLVRYRDDYARGDIQRIEVQHEFMKAFFQQVLEKDTIMNNLQSYLTTFVNYVSTDFPLTSIPKYLNPIMGLSGESISFYTAPGEAPGSYYLIDYVGLNEIVDDTFFNYEVGLTEKQKNYKISVMDGGTSQLVIQSVIQRLEKAGYESVTAGEAYTGSKSNNTRIVVKKTEYSKIIEGFFYSPKVELDSEIKDFDIIIIVGKNEKE